MLNKKLNKPILVKNELTNVFSRRSTRVYSNHNATFVSRSRWFVDKAQRSSTFAELKILGARSEMTLHEFLRLNNSINSSKSPKMTYMQSQWRLNQLTIQHARLLHKLFLELVNILIIVFTQ